MKRTLGACLVALTLLTGCTYNPFTDNNVTTGTAAGALIGAGIGSGGVALLGGSRPYIFLAGLAGGALGYYVTTLRYDAGGIYQGGGQAYQVGDKIGIYIPADSLFEPTTADFTPQAPAILDSVATVVQRYPNNDVLISGSTSGYGLTRWQLALSEKRARKVAAYLWNAGVNQFKKDDDEGMRKLTYTGYGDYFPLASDRTNAGRRYNNRIQITSYPTDCDLGIDKRHLSEYNVGDDDDSSVTKAEITRCRGRNC